ncbi:15539_t:CDS:2 [Rhizophagus irregularis]|nr:15539_t:CDS:2 [Rhizophagus irregularis]
MSLKFTLLSESVKTIEQIQRAGFLPDPVQADQSIIGLHLKINFLPHYKMHLEFISLKDMRFEPLNPKNIVIASDSAEAV